MHVASSNWTDAEDKLLEAGLAQYPSSMDKNERWTKIAEGVPGHSKKECVQRFKTIREALKQPTAAGASGASSKTTDTGAETGRAAGPAAAAAAPGGGGGGTSTSDDTSKKSRSKTEEEKGGLLIPGQAVNKTNHRRASAGSTSSGGDKGRRVGKTTGASSAAAAPAALDADATEFKPPQQEREAARHGGKKKDKKKFQRQQRQSADANGDEKKAGQVKQQQQTDKGRNKKKGGDKAIEKPPTDEQQGGGAAKKGKARKRKKKKGGKFAWRNKIPTGAVDPISLDPLVDLPYPPFALVATEPYDVISKWPVSEEEERRMELLRGATRTGDGSAEERRRIAERELGVIREQWGDAVAASASAFSGQNVETDGDEKPKSTSEGDGEKQVAETGRRYYHLFDGRVLAYYLVSQLQFIDPLNRRDLTRPELVNLDSYLERHKLGRAGVTEAYDARGVTVSTAGVAGQSAEGRAEILQQEARTLLGALFSGDSHAESSAASHRQMEARATATPRFQNEFERHYVESERRRQQQGARGGARAGGRGRNEGVADTAAEQAQDAGVYAAEEGGILVIDDDRNPGLRGGVGAAAESAQRHQQRTGRGEGGAEEPSSGSETLWSASHIADRYGHTSRVRADNFPSLQALFEGDAPYSSLPAQKPKAAQAPAKPSKSLLKISNVVKKTNPAEAARQKKATEEARRRAALANLSFEVPGTLPTGVGGDGIGTAVSAVQMAVASGGSASPNEPSAGQLQRNRAMASALGVQPATMRNNFNTGWARPTVANIELDEFGNELNAAQYPDALIIEAKERMAELLKLEKRWKTFLADDKASSQPLRAMPRDLRKFVHEYSDFWNLHTESFDPEPKRYIHCTKLRDTSVPHPLLSEAVRKWKGPGTGAPALPIRPKPGVVGTQQQHTGAREFTITEERVPLKLEPRSVPPGFVAASISVPPGAMFDAGDSALPKTQEEKESGDRQPAERFSLLLAEREKTRSKLTLAPRTKPLELPRYQPPLAKGYDIAKARERTERERKEKQEKQRKKEEKKQNILASAFASSSSDDESDANSAAGSSDWGEGQDAVFDGSDSDW